MKTKFTFLFFFLTFVGLQAQEKTKATYVGKIGSVVHVPSIASQNNLQPARVKEAVMQDGRASKNLIVPGKDSQTEDDYFVRNPNALEQKIDGKAPTLVFDAAASSSQPTDPSIGVGPNHAVVVFNTGFRIFDKSGNPLTGQLSPNPTIFPNGGCCDLTISYDNAADRFVMSFLGNGAQIAVSDGPDPLNDGWYVYTIPQINDYQKLSVWSDGYYMTDNTGSTNKIYAMERDKMLTGDPSAQIIGFPLPGIVTSGFYSPQALNVTNDNLPATGSLPIVYLQDDAWTGVSQDHVKLWTVDVDWATPGNSTISAPIELITTPFISVFDGGSFSNLAQPGGGADIDALQATVMNQAQFRKYSGHNSGVFNFVVDTDASNGELAGVRWFEIRQPADGQPWSIYQEGTYTSPNGKHAWHASMMMDVQGNIGMGYTAMAGPTTANPTNFRVSSYYTGRFANDPLNTMTVAEELIAAGNQNIPGLRYGDYSKIDLDPSNDKSFWFINEYMNSGRKDVVGVFQIAPNFNNDVGVVSIDSPVTGTLSNAETVTVTIFNYGQNSASNFPVTFQVDGGAVITETFTGTIPSATTAQYTFTATANLNNVGQTYSIFSETNLVGDEDTGNDGTTETVTFLEPNDIGVTAITAPNSGTNLSAAESIVVTITNFGGEPQSNFDVSYDLEGTVVTEVVSGPLAANSSTTYTFTQTGDFSAFGNYDLTAYTSLPNDSDTSNDSTSKVVTNQNCQPVGDCSLGDGLRLVQLTDINNPSECEGYADFTDQVAVLEPGTTYDLTLTTEYGDQHVRVWVDFNDDFLFTNDEIVVADYVIAPGQGGGSYTETTDFVVPADATLGQHLMRVKTNWNAAVPDDACEETTYGETEDYTAQIGVLTAGENNLDESEFTVLSLGNNIFDVNLNTTTFSEDLILTVYNTLGQRLLFRKIENSGDGYHYKLDMGYVSTGVYLIRLGNKTTGKIKRIIVE
ncbi:GEVED domain-containing protein [Aequorivita echinoideorum]|uniref:T9SS type A sorting domain-containing protein n=1 Tax=Aequorivita echinoideorum TaxID=1549647 RepID=A0ABS5S235_9FLAO|nr:GEVED domain-containing protein [Aequorivita echinoideorum]MBT0607277.1 T9SS type A sorting domain-containing protein [Aequorivita echinoideorum]